MNKEWLEICYVNKELSTTEIGKLCAVSASTILYWMKKHNIKPRTKSKALSGKKNPMWGKPVSLETRNKISKSSKGRKHTNETKEKIRQKFLKKPKSETCKQKLSAFAKQRFETKENHPMYGKRNSWGTHSKVAKKKISKRMQGKNNPMYGRNGSANPMWGLKGRKHPAWIEPSKRKSNLYIQIRTCQKGIEWRNLVYKRDNFTCSHCGDNEGGNLNADHIKPLAIIVHENNVKTLEEAIFCQEFWDIANGRTLCVKCHKSTATFAKPLSELLLLDWTKTN